MTALDFIALGVRFETYGGRITVRGPKDDALRASLVAEIAKRCPVDPRRSKARVGECISCLDRLETGRGGHCALCHCAIQKIVDRTMRGDIV